MKIEQSDGRDYLKYRFGGGDVVEIVDIWVRSNRRTGVGRLMFGMLLTEIKDKNKKKVYAFTRKENEIAKLFYEALGFKGTVIPEFYIEGDAVLYVYTICESP